MKNYLPQFTLRRALFAIALFSLFLGWLRPDRAKTYRAKVWCALTEQGRKKLGVGRATMQSDAKVTQGIEFSPIWPSRHIVFERARVASTEEVTYHMEFRDPSIAPLQP